MKSRRFWHVNSPPEGMENTLWQGKNASEPKKLDMSLEDTWRYLKAFTDYLFQLSIINILGGMLGPDMDGTGLRYILDTVWLQCLKCSVTALANSHGNSESFIYMFRIDFPLANAGLCYAGLKFPEGFHRFIELIWPAPCCASQVVITLLDAGVAAVRREQPPPLCLAAQKGHHQANAAIKLWLKGCLSSWTYSKAIGFGGIFMHLLSTIYSPMNWNIWIYWNYAEGHLTNWISLYRDTNQQIEALGGSSGSPPDRYRWSIAWSELTATWTRLLGHPGKTCYSNPQKESKR